MREKLAVIVLLFSAVGWGLTWIPLKALNEAGLSGQQTTFIAFLAGAIVLLPFLLRSWQHWKYESRKLLLIALFGGFANLSFQTAMTYGDVIRVMILFYLLPVWSVIGARIFLHERADALRYLAVAMSLGGAYIIIGGGKAEWINLNWNDALAISSGMALAVTNLVFRATPHIESAPKLAAMFIGCTVLVSLSMLVIKTEPHPLETSVIVYAALYGIFWLIAVTYGTQWGVTHLEAGRASVIMVMELVVAIVSAAIIAHESMSAIELLGGLLVIAAAIIEGMRSASAEHTQNASLSN